MTDIAVLDRDTVSDLLGSRSNPFLNYEENRHAWGISRSMVFERPLLRTWDYFSGSRPEGTNRMLSRAPRQCLNTSGVRRKSLTTHADHKNWTATPFISFTTSKIALQELACLRRKRGTQTITAINPNVRIAKGLPILDMMTEMNYYDILDPYGRSNAYYRDHYLCLWEVTSDEVIGHWEWSELVKNDHWYEEIVLPAFREHDETLFSNPPGGGLFNFSTLLDELLENDESEVEYPSLEDTSSDELDASFENEVYSDTDDEVEEANATDDMFKILEGDW
ncbi:hypothetical protein CNMCM5793_007199 [Aspergillus hiratsukae]|uniref:DUF7587 domain-containing protein n=1 Tax=Aspergillus hiratsukae TaxID=1194566 RepID=A0A8H6UKC4_9EURO|nr:hypothetical protein CNMCM5793_007199 [Aspergillus hiratsukae]KAF7174317.1 hypothetical protein CNMCM6106_008511 [Aspergillus hiratsukae]